MVLERKHTTHLTKKVLRHNVDLIVSFGLAGSMSRKLKNSQIIIPNVVLSDGFKSKKTSTLSNNYFKKKSRENIISNMKLLTSEKVLNKNSKLSKIDLVMIWRQDSFLKLRK